MASKKGEKYKCEQCGLVILVEDACGCQTCDLVCCSVPMLPVKAAEKAKSKTKPKDKGKGKK